MPTARPILDTRYKSKDDTYPVIIRLRHLKQVREIATGYKVKEGFWKGTEVSGKHPDAIIINQRIQQLLSQAKTYFAQCLLQEQPIRLQLIGSSKQSLSFISYLKDREDHYKAKAMVIMRRKVARLITELNDCFEQEMYFEDITQDALRTFETYLINAGNGDNTRHKKYKLLREFYGAAITEGRTEGPNPFKAYKINPVPVKKEKLTRDELQAIEDLRLKDGPLKRARDLFLFSYYAKGARFENCVTLRKRDITGGRIFFRTNKGQKFLSVKIHGKLQVILDTYKAIKGEFVFPYVQELKTDPEGYVSQIGVLNATVNRDLKKIAPLAGIAKKLSFHIARHTLAFHLKKTTESIHVIKDTLGHSDTRTTEIYLDSLDDEVLDGEMEKLYGK